MTEGRDNAPEDPKQEQSHGEQRSFFWMVLVIALTRFFQSLFQTGVFVSYFAFLLAECVSAPRGMDLFAVPLSLIGLWLVLYRFKLVVRAVRNQEE